MNQPNEDYRIRKKQQQLPQTNPQMRPKQSNYSVSSEVSFNADHKKQKSKSFNRRQDEHNQQQSSIVSIYRELQYPPEIRNALKKFCYLDKEKLIKLSVNELRQLCQKELKRIDLLRRNNLPIQRLLSDEQIDDTDNELSLIAISSQINALIEFRNEYKSNNGTNNETTAKTRLRQYETILLEIEKSDGLIKNFINTHLKLLEPSDISIPDCKRFFKKQAFAMSQSSDKIVLSRKTLCEIIIFLCRLLQGQILAFDDIYQYQDESFNSIELGDEYNKYVVQSRTVRNNTVIVQNLDQSFSDSHSQQSKNSLNNGHANHINNKNGNTYQSYSNDDLGRKVKELAGICEQIPQLQAFTRTLKFSKITLQNRQGFFKIVDVIIALHHRIGYLSRNKPALMKQIEHIESDLSEVYHTLREFVVLLTSDVPQFGELRFRNDEEARHQLTQIISYLKKDMRKLAEIICDQNETEKDLFERLQLLRAIMQTFCQSMGQGDESIWQQYTAKLLTKPLHEQQRETINWLSEFYTTVFKQLRSSIKNQQDLMTEKNLQAQVHTLLTDYQRLRGQHQELQGKYNYLLEQKDQLVFDIQERDKIIGNLTSIKISSEKRQKSLRDQLLQAQDDAGRFQQDLGILQEQLQIMSIQNQNKVNDLVYEHQTQVKQLVDKITTLQRAKMQLLGKYEDECSKSIRLLQDGNYSSVQMQTLKDRLQKKIKQHDQNNKKQKDLINALEKQLQQAKNDRSLLENKLQLAEKNKNKLMDKLQEANSKYNSSVKGFQDKYEEEIIAIKQAHYKMEKQLQKYKRSNTQLSEQLQQLKQQNSLQAKSNNDYRMKLLQFNSIQNEYDSLVKEYDRVVDTFHKLQTNNQTLKQKLFELTSKQQEILQLLAREKQLNRKLEKKCKQQDLKLQEIINSYEGNDQSLREQQKLNKMLQKKISQLQRQIQSLQDSILNKDKSHSLTINKSQIKHQQVNGQLQQQINKLNKTNHQLQSQNDKLLGDIKIQQKQLKQHISDYQLKEIDWHQKEKQLLRANKAVEKKLLQSEEERLALEDKLRLLQQQAYNQSILIQQIKQEKHMYELRVTEKQQCEKTQLTQLRKGIQQMQHTQNSLKNKISKLQTQVQRLCGQIQQLKLIIREKDKEIEQTHEQANKRLKQKQAQQQEKKQQQYQSRKTQEITQIRQQILIEKNVIITENKKLHEQNNTLQQEIAKLRLLNQALQTNINKLSAQSKQQTLKEENNFKLTVNKHLFTISSLENELQSVNAERQSFRKDYEQLQGKFQTKTKALAEKDNLLFERQLEKNNLEKIIKELKFKINQLQTVTEGLTASMDKIKNHKLRPLELEITQLNGLLQQWKKKEELARSALYDTQQQLQKLKRDNAKKLQTLKEQHLQLQEQYKTQIKKIQSQHSIDLMNLQHKTRKDTENQFNQLLIKEKQIFNNLTIQKIQELGQMQKKYEKLIRDQRNDKNLLQQDYNRLQTQLNELKRNKSINDSRILQEQEESENTTMEELHKLKAQYQLLKRQNSRLQQQNNRLLNECTNNRQENSSLQSKSLQSQHTITILTSKLHLLNQNLQTTKKTIQQMHKLQLDNLTLQRQVEKLKTKAISDDNRANDYRARLQEMDHKINDLQGKLQQWKHKEFEWTRSNDQSTERFRALNTQSSDMSLKLQQMKLKLQEMTNKLTQKTQKLQTIETQLQLTQQKVKQKQIQLTKTKQHLQSQIQLLQEQLTKKSNNNIMLQRQKKQLILEWQCKQNQLNDDNQLKARRVRQLEMQLAEYKRNLNKGNRMIEELTKVRNQKSQLQGKFNRLQLEVGKYQADKLSLERQNDLLAKELTAANNQASRLSDQKRNLEHQLRLILSQNEQLLNQNQSLLRETDKLKQLSSSELEHVKDNLLLQFDEQRKSIQTHYQELLKQLNAQLTRQRQKHSQLLNKHNRLLQQTDDLQKMLDILRKENMQLSDHCQKYQARIKILQERLHSLENDHQLKGQSALQIENKYHSLQFQLNKTSDLLVAMKGELQRVNSQNGMLKERITQLEQQLQQVRNNNKLLNLKLTQLDQQLESALKNNKLLDLKLNQLTTENDKKSNQLKNISDKLNQSLNELQSTNSSLLTLRTQNSHLHQSLSQSNTQRQQLQQSITSYQQTTLGSNSQLQTLKAQISKLQKQLSQKNNLLSQTTSSLKSMTNNHEQKLSETQDKLQWMRNQNNTLVDKINQTQRELQLLANEFGTLQQRLHQAQRYIQWSDNQRKTLEERLRILIADLQQQKLQNQQQLNKINNFTQQSAQIHKLMAELALTRQQLVRLNQVIKRKQQDFNQQLSRVSDQKNKTWKQNQLLAQQYQTIKIRLDQMQRVSQIKSKQLQDVKQQKVRLVSQIDQLRKQLATNSRQLAELNQLVGQANKKQQQLLRTLHQQSTQSKRLQQQLSNQRRQTQHFIRQNQHKDQTIMQLSKQLQTISNQSSTKNIMQSSMKQDLDKCYQQLNHLRSVIMKLQTDNHNINSHLMAKDRIINEMKDNVNKGNELMENADRELKKSFEERNQQQVIIRQLNQERDNLNINVRQLTQQKDSYLQIIKMKESQTITLKETITILERRITQMTTQIHTLTSQVNQPSQQQLTQSRSNINLVTKSYSYQAGQVTSAQLARLQQQNRRLIKEIQSKDKTISFYALQIQRLTKEIKILKQQIHLLQSGKTINLKGYTRVTNPNDTSLNTKGIIYTEYDVKEMKAKIQLLEKSLSRYQDRQTQLLRQIEKYKFRQRHYLEQVRVLEENAKASKNRQPDSVREIPPNNNNNSPQKKTAFDQDYNNRQNQPQSSTYRLQTGIQVTQRSINMTKKQLKTTQKYFLRVEADQLRKIIDRLTNGQHIVNSKIDQILNTTQKTNKQTLELVLTNNQFNLTPVIINEIRQLIHQNKALVETLKSMKQFKQDVGLLMQQYIDPELLTQFVYRILTYFSEVSDQSPQAREIRQQLNLIRKNNVSGFYFTVLEEYTKYILQNNSIQIYKEELRQKARELISFREKFQAIIDSKLDENDKLLNRSDSKNSFLHRSRTKYMGSSRMGSSRGKSQCSEISRQDNQRVRQIMPASNVSGNGNNGNRISLPVGPSNILPNPIHLLTGAGNNNNMYSNLNQQNYMPNIALSPGLITAERARTSSTLTYTPYNKQQLVSQNNTPTQSINDSRVHVSYSATQTSHMANSYTTVNSSNTVNFMKPGLERKL